MQHHVAQELQRCHCSRLLKFWRSGASKLRTFEFVVALALRYCRGDPNSKRKIFVGTAGVSAIKVRNSQEAQS